MDSIGHHRRPAHYPAVQATLRRKRLLGLSATTETARWRFRLPLGLGSYRETANRRFGCEGTTRICRTCLRVPHVPGVSTSALSGPRLIMAFQPPEGLVAPPTALGPYVSHQPRLRSDIRHHGIGGDYVISGYFHVTGSFT